MNKKLMSAMIICMISILVVTGCGKEKRNANEVVVGLDVLLYQWVLKMIKVRL